MFVDKLATLFSQHLEGSGLEWPCPADIYPPYLPRSFLQAQSLPQASEVSGGAAIYAGTNAAHPNNIHRCKVCEAQNQPLPGGSSCPAIACVKADLFSSHAYSGDLRLLEGLNRMNFWQRNPHLLDLKDRFIHTY